MGNKYLHLAILKSYKYWIITETYINILWFHVQLFNKFNNILLLTYRCKYTEKQIDFKIKK
jgi:hypothetical protein